MYSIFIMENLIKKAVPTVDWQERLQLFTSGNKGRLASIATQEETLAENKKFKSLNYDPVGKGNDIVIAVEDFIHIVTNPVELWFSEEENGVMSTVEIKDQNGQMTFLRLL